MLGVPLLVVIIPAIATSHATPQWVFTQWLDEYAKASSGIENSFYIFMLGLLLPAFSYVGWVVPPSAAFPVLKTDVKPI